MPKQVSETAPARKRPLFVAGMVLLGMAALVFAFAIWVTYYSHDPEVLLDIGAVPIQDVVYDLDTSGLIPGDFDVTMKLDRVRLKDALADGPVVIHSTVTKGEKVVSDKRHELTVAAVAGEGDTYTIRLCNFWADSGETPVLSLQTQYSETGKPASGLNDVDKSILVRESMRCGLGPVMVFFALTAVSVMFLLSGIILITVDWFILRKKRAAIKTAGN